MTSYLNIVASVPFTDASGAPINGMLTVTPSSISQVGGGGQADAAPIKRRLTNGLLATPLTLANPAYTSPQSIGYTFTLSNGKGVSTYTNVLIQDDGTGQWDISQLNTGQYVIATPTSTPSTSAASNTITYPAAVAVSQYQVVCVDDIVTPTATAYQTPGAMSIIGVATNSAQPGANVTIQYSGIMTNPAWAFLPNPVFCDANAAVTQTVPSTGCIQVIGVAISPTSIIISPQQPILLA